MFPPQTFSYPTFEAEEILQVRVVFRSPVDPSVDAFQQLGSALSIQDVNVFFYTSFKKYKYVLKCCLQERKWCLILLCKLSCLLE